MRITHNGIQVDWYRCPKRLELCREVIPILLGVFFVALALGYAWAKAAYMGFVR